jgi:hypothetical protein
MGGRRSISLKSIATGVAADIGGSLLAGLLIGFAYGLALGFQGASEKEIVQALESTGYLIQSVVIGFGFTVLGGYVAARRAKFNLLLHGGVVGCVGLAFGLLFWAEFPLWFNLVSLLGVIPFAVLGGILALPKQQAANS